ncbi:WXG100 family type VII secretion target [Nocardioides sp. NPDC006303]|uniref:WXG100 family type VII secretion target n=1 Tax=Nocardioides sp. NPDC006303 TaxID=3156747 RepID=UPI0033B53FD6
MSVDTEIEGKPAQVESAADWVRDKLAKKLDDAVDKLNDSRRNADGSWNSDAGDEFVDMMSRARDKTEKLHDAAKSMADDLDDFAEKLRRCQNQMEDVRADARAAKLVVSGFKVEDPGAPPATPPASFSGTPEQVAQYEKDVEVYNDHMGKVVAYGNAKSEAERIDRQYAAACESLQKKYSVNQHAAWILNGTEILGAAAAGAIGVDIATKQSKLHTRAQELVDEVKRAIDDLQAHPERYTKRKWLFFETLDETKLRADQLALEGKLSQAEKLLDDAAKLEDGKVPKFLGRAGKVLGPLGIGLGIYNDYKEGETGTQIAVSQGVSAGAGIVAGGLASAGASMATGAAMGAAFGSVVPGLGTAVGAVVGTAVGAGVAIFADGAIDSLFENGPDVGKALDEGMKSLKDTGDAIGDAASSVKDTVGGWFD